jgi:hypothetical protein
MSQYHDVISLRSPVSWDSVSYMHFSASCFILVISTDTDCIPVRVLANLWVVEFRAVGFTPSNLHIQIVMWRSEDRLGHFLDGKST